MTPRKLAITALTLSLVACMSFSSAAFADPIIEKAEAELAELRFDDAKELATKALLEGTRGPKDTASLYMILGRIAASLGDSKEAKTYFRSALSIEKSTTLPDGVSPKLSEPFAAAQSSLGDASPIAMLAEIDEQHQLSIQFTSDPAKLVGGAEARFVLRGKATTLREKGIDIVRLDIPAEASTLTVVATDKFGNALNEAVPVDTGRSPQVLDKPKTKSTKAIGASASTSPPLHRRWELYAGLAVATMGTGAFFGNASQSKTDEIAQLPDGTEFSIAQGLEDDAKSKALVANLSFAATGLLGAAAIWMYLSDEPAKETAPVAVVIPVVGDNRVGLAASLRF